MAKIRRMNLTLLTQSGWTQDQDSCSLSELLALRSLACGSPARHRVFFNVGKAGNLSSAKEVPEASEATDHVSFPEAVSSARSRTPLADCSTQFVQCLNSPDSETGDRCPQ